MEESKNINDVNAGRDVVMGNQTNNNYYNSEDLARMTKSLQEMVELLRESQSRIQLGGDMKDSVIVQGEHNSVSILRGDVNLIRVLQSRAAPEEREKYYLAHLLCSEDFAPWERLYVPLSGKVDVRQALNHLPIKYSELVMPVDGNGQVETRELDDIKQAMDIHPSFIILGAPGAGKTTTQQKIAFDSAKGYFEKGSGRIPLFVRLSDQHDAEPYAFLKKEWEESVGTPFNESLDAGRILFLLDGVNEIPREGRNDRLKAWRSFHQKHHGKNQFIFSGRRLDYENELDFPRVIVNPLKRGQIIEFAKLQQADGLIPHLEDPNSRLIELADNPLNLLVLTIVQRHYPNQNFENRGKLFESFTKYLMDLEHREHFVGISVESAKLALSHMAFTMQEQGEGLTFENKTARKAVPDFVEVNGEEVRIDAVRLFSFGRGSTVLDPARDPDVRFRHQVLQEYFAAREMLRRFNTGEDLSVFWKAPHTKDEMPAEEVGEWDPLPEPPTTGWEVTTILACGLSNDPAKLIEAVRQQNPALAGRCLDEAGIQTDGMEVKQAVRIDLLTDLYNPAMHLRTRLQAGFILGRIGDPRFEPQEVNGVKVVLPQMVDVPAGNYQIGSRQGEEDSYDDEQPQHTVELKAFSIGKWSVTNAEYACFMEAGGYENEKYWEGDLAQRWLKGEDVSGGQFSTWLNIWKQLQGMKEQGDVRKQLESTGNFSPDELDSYEYVAGLTEEELKEQLGKELSQKSRSQPAFWNDRERNNPSQPVVGITWFEARAYCTWLSEVTGKLYYLPTEVEWEAAARGLPDGEEQVKKYPWGNDWDKEKANSIEGRVMKPSPVGAYSAAGALGPFDAEDQAGNVYDWTSSLYLPYPYDAHKTEEIEADGDRTVRGGSWLSNRRNVRCAARSRHVPDGFGSNIGFRLVSSGS